MNREVKFRFVFQHPESKEVIVSKAYTLTEVLKTNLDNIAEETCTCDCQPIGETNVVECNCYDYYGEFNLIKEVQYTGLKDRNGVEIYEGDIVKWGMHPSSEECWHRYAEVKINPDIQFQIIYYVDAKTGEQKPTDNYSFRFGRFAYKDTHLHLEVIGNIYQHPELLTNPN